MRVARRFLVSGRVQGVGFRYFVRIEGQREGLLGWVRNRLDGRVEIECEGDQEAVARFEQAIRQGPPGARVDEMTAETLPNGLLDRSFTIR